MISFERIQSLLSLSVHWKKEVQNIKENFNKKIMSIMGSKIGKDNELCFLSFKNKKQKVLDKQSKGYGG
jgi:hypothetical protein